MPARQLGATCTLRDRKRLRRGAGRAAVLGVRASPDAPLPRCGRVNVIARRAHDGEGELCGCARGTGGDLWGLRPTSALAQRAGAASPRASLRTVPLRDEAAPPSRRAPTPLPHGASPPHPPSRRASTATEWHPMQRHQMPQRCICSRPGGGWVYELGIRRCFSPSSPEQLRTVDTLVLVAGDRASRRMMHLTQHRLFSCELRRRDAGRAG